MAGTDAFFIQDVKIFTGASFIDQGYVHVVNGKIEGFGQGAPSPSSIANQKVLSFPGSTLTPGLIESHVHITGGDVEALKQSLRFGITTLCDLHNEPEICQSLRKIASDPANRATHCDVKYAGHGATIENGWPAQIVKIMAEHVGYDFMVPEGWPKLKDPSEAAAFVQDQVRIGASYIKLMHESGILINKPVSKPSLELQKAVVDAAHAAGLPCIGHATSLQDTLELLRCGVDGLAHTICDQSPTDELVALYQQTGAHCNPTLSIVGAGTGETEDKHHAFAQDAAARRLLPDEKAVQSFCECVHFAKQNGRLEHAIESVKALHRAGVPILAGSDTHGGVGCAFGLSLHQEMRMLAEMVGMDPSSVLRSATKEPAARLGLNDRGVIDIGKKADLALFEGDLEANLASEGLVLPVSMAWRDGVASSFWTQAKNSINA